METQLRDLGIHPQYPFIHLFQLHFIGPFLTKLFRFLWYFCHNYYIAIEVHVSFLLKYLKELGMFPYSQNFNGFFLWFDSLQTWKIKLKAKLKNYLTNPQFGRLKIVNAYTTIMFHRHHSLFNNRNLLTSSSYSFYKTNANSVHLRPLEFY